MCGGIGLVDGNELRQFFFEQFVLGLETVNLAEGFGQNLAERDPPVGLHGLAEFVEVEEVLRLVEQVGDDDFLRALDVAPFVSLAHFRRGLDLVLEFLEELAVNLHAVDGHGVFDLRLERVRVHVGVAVVGPGAAAAPAAPAAGRP